MQRTRVTNMLNTEDTKRVQALLQLRKLYTGKIDGIYGPLTSKAVKQWQLEHDFEPTTGMITVGDETWQEMFPAPAPVVESSQWMWGVVVLVVIAVAIAIGWSYFH